MLSVSVRKFPVVFCAISSPSPPHPASTQVTANQKGFLEHPPRAIVSRTWLKLSYLILRRVPRNRFTKVKTEVQVGHKSRNKPTQAVRPCPGVKPRCWAAPLPRSWLVSAPWKHPCWAAESSRSVRLCVLPGAQSRISRSQQVERGSKWIGFVAIWAKVQIPAARQILLSLDASSIKWGGGFRALVMIK